MSLIDWIILGLIVGAIAKAVIPHAGDSLLPVILFGVVGLLGIIGAQVGHNLGVFLNMSHLGMVATGFSLPGIAVAVVSAIITIFVWNLLTRHTTF